MTSSNIDTWRLFWAKTLPQDGETRATSRRTHPLWAHFLDVACAAHATYPRLPSDVRDRLASALGLKENEAKTLLALLIGLHDVGKAIPSFQVLHEPSAVRLSEPPHGLGFGTAGERRHHGHASIPVLHDWIEQTSVADQAKPVLKTLTAFAGFHHGRLDARSQWCERKALGESAWGQARHRLVEAVAEAWMEAHGGWPDLSEAALPPRRGLPYPPAVLAFAGWTTLADWVGSMAEHMPEANADDDLIAYIDRSRQAARCALAETKLSERPRLQATSGEADFKRCFPDVFADDSAAEPRALQRLAATVKLPTSPTLVIVEAPTGEGKSEAAFYLAARLQARRPDRGRGVYVALPTQATSNGLFPRFLRFVEAARAGETSAGAMLVHGASALNAELGRLLHPVDEDEAVRSGVYAARWFLPNKRGLLAPYGVGTVDQALLGALLSRHFFLRLYGLAGKVVVFDEVHAYDGYMAALFARLLAWLRVLGADVVVLSATLPKATRKELLAAWDAADVPDVHADDYPAITITAGSGKDEERAPEVKGGFETEQARRTEKTGSTKIRFEDSAEDHVAALAAEAAQEGATVGVIVNLVSRAQQVYQRLLTMQREGTLDADLVLLHARFPFEERERREQYVVGYRDENGCERPGRFGKHRHEAFGGRPAILVATQVAEQSLDLDVDLMLTDLAPIDLLLQRAGRLHRHDLPRPPGFERPALVILCPDADADPLPDMSTIGGQRKTGDLDAVYLNLPLFKTYRRLRCASGWTLPADYRPLIEAVYGEDTGGVPEELGDKDQARWKVAVADRDRLVHQQHVAAGRSAVADPSNVKSLVSFAEDAARTRYDEHDDAPAQDFRPVTRLGGPSVQVVCLVRNGDGVTLDGEAALPEGPKLNGQDVCLVLRRAVRLSRRSVVEALRETEPALWKETPALAFHHPLEFENGRCTVGDTVLALDAHLGLVYDSDRR